MKEHKQGNFYLMFDSNKNESWAKFHIQGKKLLVDSAFEPKINLKNAEALRDFLDDFVTQMQYN